LGGTGFVQTVKQTIQFEIPSCTVLEAFHLVLEGSGIATKSTGEKRAARNICPISRQIGMTPSLCCNLIILRENVSSPQEDEPLPNESVVVYMASIHLFMNGGPFKES
jgi:hypothetical protein